MPLEGNGLRVASGDNPNPLFRRAAINEPLVSKEIRAQYPALYKVFEYDVETVPGGVYEFVRGL